MQDYQELVPDAEMFARVWKRVMPDESLSRIVVHPPEEKKPKPPEPVLPPQSERDERGWLRDVLESMDEGRVRCGEILRRDPGAWPLWESINKSAAQLKAAWLLLTGERWKSSGRRYPGGMGMESLIREQYLWELRFSELCRQAAREIRTADAAEIMGEQERESGRRRRMLRHMLARGK